MRLIDLLGLVWDNIGRRKGRVALTAIGVVIGTAAVILLVSLAIGLQQNATRQLGGISDLTLINVSPTYGEFYGGGGGGGFGGVVVEGGPGTTVQQTLITTQSLKDFAALPGVVAVYPRDFLQGGAILKYGQLENYPNILGVTPEELVGLDLPVAQGTSQIARGLAVIGAIVPNGFYNPRQRPNEAPPPPPELADEKVNLVLSRWSSEGVETRRTIALRVAGVLGETRGESDYTMYVPLADLEAYNQWLTGRRPNRNRDGYPSALVRARDSSVVLDLADQITAMGYQAYTPLDFVQGINSFFIVLQVVFGGVGAIALLVAAIGIANTMTMAILERTREIGLMKALGATNGTVLALFLGEAAGIGFLGGLGGVLLGWAAGQAINVLALAYLAGQTAQTGGLPPSVAVQTPTWLPFFALAFATVVGLLSGLYPALRAATIIPVTALRYE